MFLSFLVIPKVSLELIAVNVFSFNDLYLLVFNFLTKGNFYTIHLLRLLSTASKSIAIVAIDFAGLTTNTKDLIQWLRDHETLKIVLIDNIEALNQSYTFTREQLLSDISVLRQFDPRPAPIKRLLKS
ncbi:hypothetical protein AB4K20DRAFT_1948659 [Rhizopus microsporus]